MVHDKIDVGSLVSIGGEDWLVTDAAGDECIAMRQVRVLGICVAIEEVLFPNGRKNNFVRDPGFNYTHYRGSNGYGRCELEIKLQGAA